jgi:hypothetical protein
VRAEMERHIWLSNFRGLNISPPPARQRSTAEERRPSDQEQCDAAKPHFIQPKTAKQHRKNLGLPSLGSLCRRELPRICRGRAGRRVLMCDARCACLHDRCYWRMGSTTQLTKIYAVVGEWAWSGLRVITRSPPWMSHWSSLLSFSSTIIRPSAGGGEGVGRT